MDINWDHRILPGNMFTVNDVPYHPSVATESQEKIKASKVHQMSTAHYNILKSKDWKGHDLMGRMNILLRRKKQEICRGTVSFFTALYTYCMSIELSLLNIHLMV